MVVGLKNVTSGVMKHLVIHVSLSSKWLNFSSKFEKFTLLNIIQRDRNVLTVTA